MDTDFRKKGNVVISTNSNALILAKRKKIANCINKRKEEETIQKILSTLENISERLSYLEKEFLIWQNRSLPLKTLSLNG